MREITSREKEKDAVTDKKRPEQNCSGLLERETGLKPATLSLEG